MESNYIKFNNGRLEVCLDLVIFTSDEQRIVYAPTLDIMSYGIDDAAALSSFDIVLKETLMYMVEHKTLAPELERLGWNKKNELDNFSAPLFTSFVDKRKELRDIVNTYNFQKISKSVSVSCC